MTIPVPKTGTFGDLKRAYSELFDIPPAEQVWGGSIGELGVEDDVRFFEFSLLLSPHLRTLIFSSHLHNLMALTCLSCGFSSL